ncbi:tRNA-splicing endonuclease subunit [Coemansia thaxteri]|uniref:tRNA-splicing endonuclease subunit SEN34 n=1 Tax=Coemansia thaxteri TaxID=2663907 RepID=A0A9W8BLC6_9FUNG|nr:tRNA-splicing endonuclease subunit [Coemansia thaxteri]KAJ2009001.1 tRNA-splicing endonuclease subunit [Coemansia thaxteri]KAJ2473242.1 tRNA-splicing endonuclease subunit [Coemansia sp. RSA 2322]KAJ2485693.1 tRNA-splicing endonuclease subunit [Coemansia sp. RSA 2320]
MEPLRLECRNGLAMAFDPDTVLRLRRDFRIVGALEGSHPANPMQNNYFGLPLVLLPEEAALLADTPGTTTLDRAQLSWPRTEHDHLRFNLYKDLHSRGYYITRAIKFGGDYLLYPGEPMRYHSHYIVSLLGHEQPLAPRELISLGRLATTVKKTRLLCSWDPSARAFAYVCLNWSEIG